MADVLSGVTRVVLSHGPKAMWDQYDPVLFEGEVGFETQEDGAWKVKVGNGQTPWHLLDYSIDFQAIMAAMAAAALSATNAATSETNAANSAAAAAGSEQSVADNAAAALQSKIAAAQSALAASDSEWTADQKATACAQALADLLAAISSSVCPLSGGKVPMQYIPATATGEKVQINSESELITLTTEQVQKGDVAELFEMVNGERTVTKSWQLLTDDPSDRDNWVVCGTSYAVQAGNATTAGTALDSTKMNGHMVDFKTYDEFGVAVKDPDTYYFVTEAT